MIPFNKPFIIGNEIKYIQEAVNSGKISGDGIFTQKCHHFFENRYGFTKCLLTTSCTDALEMTAILANIKPGDEVIAPSFTFVSTVNAFMLRGAEIVFADSKPYEPNIDEDSIESLITPKTKALVLVHYGGVACNMEKIIPLVQKHQLLLVEDAAQAVDSYYVFAQGERKALGSFGHFAAFSFHETKNVMAGEGGMLVVNVSDYIKRAEIIREKGTNRSAFFRGEIDKYGWVDIGSSFLPSEINAAFLFAQLEQLDTIQTRRKEIWQLYHQHLSHLAEKGNIQLPFIPPYATNNAHLFYIVCSSARERDHLIHHLKKNGIYAAFHYQSLHKSPFYLQNHPMQHLPHADKFSNSLLRLPMYYELTNSEVEYIAEKIKAYY
jgi:dTDP-4-amino-4,6-dideoxygalactose transaminase